MDKNDTNLDSAEPRSITLRDLYTSVQDQLVLTIEKSLDLGKEDLARRLDDVLLRQRFWEADIHMEDGALSDLEANDALAASIIGHYIYDIRRLLHNINEIISGSSNDISDENLRLSLLCETNSRLCDQVEIFDAIAAITDAAGDGRKDTMIGRMRHQLEEIHERLQSGGKNTSQALSQVLNARGLTKDAALDEDQRQIDARMQAMGNSVSPPIPTRPRSSISKDQEQRPFCSKSNESDSAQNPLYHDDDENAGEYGNSFDDSSRPRLSRSATDDDLH